MEIPSSSRSVKAILGQGYNVKKDRFSGQCVASETIFVGDQQAFATFDRSIDSSSLATSLGFEVGGKARYGVFEGSASASFLAQASSSSYAETTIYSSKISFKNAKFDPLSFELTDKVGKKVKKEDQNFVWDDWENVCGHEYVDQIVLGAALYFCARIEFSSREEKDKFKAEFNIQGPAFQASGVLDQASSKFAGKASIVISAYQLGGKVGRLSTVFDAVTVTEDKKEANALLNCSFENPAACIAVLNNMLKYATDDSDPNAFPQQINDGVLDTSSPSGPAALIYLTAPWSDLAFLPPSPLIAAIVEDSRNELSILFEENFEIRNRINNLKSLNIPFSPRQQADIQRAEAIVLSNMSLINRAADVCYDNPEQCPLAVNRIKPQIKRVVKSKLDFFPETFAQWFAIKDLPSTLISTTVVIDALVDRFKDRFRDFDAIDKADQGRVLEDFLSTLEELDLSFPFAQGRVITRKTKNSTTGEDEVKKVSLEEKVRLDLRPIAGLIGLRRLSVENQGIENLKFLRNLTELEELRLPDNMISSIEPLSALRNLTVLDLRKNSIDDITPLAGLSNLEALDIGFNDITTVDSLDRLNKLSMLDLSANKITQLSSLGGLVSLRNLNLDDNPITLISGSRITLRTLAGCLLSGISGIDIPVTANRVDTVPDDALFIIRLVEGEGQIRTGDRVTVETSPNSFFCCPDGARDILIRERDENTLGADEFIFRIFGFGPDEIQAGNTVFLQAINGNTVICPGGEGPVFASEDNGILVEDEQFAISIRG
jgi:Leucine-rich repeat (LRR) protein